MLHFLFQHVKLMNMVYSLPITFGLLVLPEFIPFSHFALVEATREDVGKYDYGWRDGRTA